ncbi:hypothetical protein [Luethyella okanaganae]|uniref:Uncharacterized protein n=1 Tax=Luethyella okanaganae TaxID=69372 RepID=A0ABW1VFU4_9MICO
MNRSHLSRLAGLVAAVIGASIAITAIVPASAVTSNESRVQLRVPAPGHSVSWEVTSPADTHARRIVLSLADSSGAALQGADSLRFILRDSHGITFFNGGTVEQLRAERFDLGEFSAGEELRVEARAVLPETAGNEYRTAQASLAFRVDAEQNEQGGILAFTGLDVSGMLALALSFIVGAILLLLVGRRRNIEKEGEHNAAS